MSLYAYGKYLLLDLDGTLTDTADISLKPMKDGQVQTDLSQIIIFEGALEFLSKARELGFENIIISDSHTRYVNPILTGYFGEYCSAALSLAEKPNTLKTLRFLSEKNIDISKGSCYLVGDSWLDVELGRGLGVPTIMTEFYKAENLEIRDGIGDYVKKIKSGCTYYAKNYSEILDILQNPLQKLLCVEAKFQAGLGAGLILIQSSIDGGSRFTVRAAVESNRPVGVIYPVKRDIHLEYYSANKKIIENGLGGLNEFAQLKNNKNSNSKIVVLTSKKSYPEFEAVVKSQEKIFVFNSTVAEREEVLCVGDTTFLDYGSAVLDRDDRSTS